ncbi:MAG: 2-isopropylmalate synthase [Deltaproteobacteria bacterium]|nr:2-isopropylmalate synthase [Deltaproteobacteria bacterium]MBW2204388.1 2-isopropylmalate synthase [Deltaproteobacteria bacterium]
MKLIGVWMVMDNLIHTDKPNLIEDIFSYDQIPRITFDGKIYEEVDGKLIQFDPADLLTRDIHITDTTFRDGQQARPPYTVEQIVHIYSMLSKLGGPNGVIRQSEFFLYSAKDKEAVQKCQELGHPYPEITGWIRAEKGDFRLVKEMGLKETGMLTSCSDYHIFNKMHKTREKAMSNYLAVVEEALAVGVRPRCHLEDLTRADISGFVLPFVQQLMRLSEQVPEKLKVKIRLCDTMGYGISFPGASLPRSVPKLVYKMIHEGGVPSDRLEWHGHNDFHKVHINGTTAWLYGCNAVNTTLLGFGERTGNPPLEGAVIEYIGIKGDMNGIDTMMITRIAEYYRNVIKAAVPERYPFVGTGFNVTSAGIHADGLSKDEHIYNIFDTRKFLDRPPRVAITDKSGVDGIANWVNEYLGLKGTDRLSKAKVGRVARWVRDQYEKHGRITVISDEELIEVFKQHLPEYFK